MHSHTVRQRPTSRVDSRGPNRHAVGVVSNSVADWRRLKLRVTARMRHCGYETQEQLAAAMKVSRATVSNIFTLKAAVSNATLIALDEALLWELGSSENILGGGEPKPIDEPGNDGRRPEPGRHSQDRSGNPGSDFVGQLRTLRERSVDRNSFIRTVLLLVGESDNDL